MLATWHGGCALRCLLHVCFFGPCAICSFSSLRASALEALWVLMLHVKKISASRPLGRCWRMCCQNKVGKFFDCWVSFCRFAVLLMETSFSLSAVLVGGYWRLLGAQWETPKPSWQLLLLFCPVWRDLSPFGFRGALYMGLCLRLRNPTVRKVFGLTCLSLFSGRHRASLKL